MSDLPIPVSNVDLYLNELCKRKLLPILALNAVNTNSLSSELNLVGANSIKFYVEITGTGTIQIDVLGSSASGGVFVSNGTSRYFSNSQSFMLPCTSDYVKVQMTVLSGSPIVTVRAQGLSDSGVDDVIPKYKDLGEVINTTNIVAGAIVYSDTFYGLHWVRNLFILAKSSQIFDIAYLAIDTNGLSGAWHTPLQTSNGPAAGVWIPLKFTTVLGYACKFAIKNPSAATATYANMKVQLMGV